MIIAGKYEVLGKLGQGGRGSMYKARHLGLHEVRALKMQSEPRQVPMLYTSLSLNGSRSISSRS